MLSNILKECRIRASVTFFGNSAAMDEASPKIRPEKSSAIFSSAKLFREEVEGCWFPIKNDLSAARGSKLGFPPFPT